MDISPTKVITKETGYMNKGMSGGPVLMLLSFLQKLYS